MKETTTEMAVPDEVIMNKIYHIRGQKVMLDRDLAEMYGVETKRLKEQVKRNISRFPANYMFQLTEREYASLRSQFATSKTGRGGTRYLPMAFTEHGVLQLSNVLKSERAEKVSFIIIDVFVKLREFVLDNTELRLEIEQIKKRVDKQNKSIELVFHYLDELLEKKEKPKPRTRIGFKVGKEKN